jgi:DNA polymerase-1
MSDSSKRKRIFVVDGHALAFRSFYAFMKQSITNSKGEELGAVFGFASALVRLLDKEKPDYFVVTFDPKGPTFRHKQYAQYKATRQKMPEEMREQLPRIFEVVKALGLKTLQIDNYEADDVMATIAKQALAEDLDVLLVTGDKDFGQIVGDHLKLYNIHSRQHEVEIIDAAAIEAKFGVPPEQMRDLLALMGDASDNIPGVKKVGKKTAATLLQKYGSLENVYNNLPDHTGKALGRNLTEYKDDAFLSQHLVTLVEDVEFSTTIEEMKWEGNYPAEAAELFKEFEFRKLLGYVTTHKEEPVEKQPEIEKHYEAVTTEAGLKRLLALMRGAGDFSFDTETTSTHAMLADLVGMSFSAHPGRAYYVPLHHFEDLDGPAVLELVRPLLEDANIAKTAYNAKYDYLVMRRAGVDLLGLEFDPMIASYLLDPGQRSHGLDANCLKYLDYQKIPTKELLGSGQKQITMLDVELDQVSEYACEDADFTQRLKVLLQPKLAENGVGELFADIEMPLVFVLAEMEWNGVALDVGLLEKLSSSLGERLEELKSKIFEAADGEFNINSPQQLGEIFFDKLRIHDALGYKPKKTKTGQWRTDVNVLEALKAHPLPKLLLEWRQLSKLKSTYTDALPKLIHPETGRIHGSLNQTVAATGRLSSTDPNLQNIPVRTELGREMRKAFIPGEGYECLMSADYSQIELRIAAHYSKDANLVNAFKTGQDIHRETASLVFNVMPMEVDRDQRDFAKRINFGILYGMGPYRFAQETGVSFGEAKTFIENYKATFTGINDYLEKTLTFALDKGYVTTMFDRRRYLPELNSTNQGIRSRAENMAINTPIQGTAADIIKKAMVEIHHELIRLGLKSKMTLQVHDELIFDVAPGELDQLRQMVVRKMENAVDLIVPVIADVGVGNTWAEAH